MKRLRLRFRDRDGNEGIVRFWINNDQNLDDAKVSSIASIFNDISDAVLLEVAEIAERKYNDQQPTSGSRIQTGCAIMATTVEDEVYILVVPAAKDSIFSTDPYTFNQVTDSSLLTTIKNAFDNTPIVDANGVHIDTSSIVAFKVS